MKRTLLTSVALGAMVVGASISNPTFDTGFVTPAAAQDAGQPEEMPAGEEGATETPDAGATDEPAAGGAEEPAAGGAEEPAAGGAEEPTDEPAGGTDEPAGGTETPTDAPAGDEPPADPATDEPPADEPATDDAATEDAAAPDDAAATEEASGEMFIPEQGEEEVSANTYIGQSLYNMEDESIGDISDLIFGTDGGVRTAVVGVGGFLGIGQKDVGVNFDMIEIEQQPDSADVRLVIDATREELEAAQEFLTLDEKMAEQQSQQPAAPAGGAGGMAPAPAPAPAQ